MYTLHGNINDVTNSQTSRRVPDLEKSDCITSKPSVTGFPMKTDRTALDLGPLNYWRMALLLKQQGETMNVKIIVFQRR